MNFLKYDVQISSTVMKNVILSYKTILREYSALIPLLKQWYQRRVLGFIIVPALIFFTRLPVKVAIGTSLFIIMMKSFIGFLGDLQTTSMDWEFLITFSILAALGIMIGVQVAKRTKAQNLKTIFGWFILIVGIYVIFKELSGF